jgi:hypothetical protein
MGMDHPDVIAELKDKYASRTLQSCASRGDPNFRACRVRVRRLHAIPLGIRSQNRYSQMTFHLQAIFHSHRLVRR